VNILINECTQCDLRGVAEQHPESHKDPRLKSKSHGHSWSFYGRIMDNLRTLVESHGEEKVQNTKSVKFRLSSQLQIIQS